MTCRVWRRCFPTNFLMQKRLKDMVNEWQCMTERKGKNVMIHMRERSQKHVWFLWTKSSVVRSFVTTVSSKSMRPVCLGSVLANPHELLYRSSSSNWDNIAFNLIFYLGHPEDSRYVSNLIHFLSTQAFMMKHIPPFAVSTESIKNLLRTKMKSILPWMSD